MRSLAIAAILALGASAAGAARTSTAPRIAWADSHRRAGWVADSPAQGRFRCTPKRYRRGIFYEGARYAVAALCATADGGRTWRPVLYEGSRFISYVRLSPRIGAVIATGHLVQHDPPVFESWWDAIFTLDGGRHWFYDYLDVDVEGQHDPDPWGCHKPGCPPPTFRIGVVNGKRTLLSDASDGHTYAVEGLWKKPTPTGCGFSSRAPYWRVSGRYFCPIPASSGLWLRELR